MLNYKGVKVGLSANKLPAGYAKIDIAEVSGKYKEVSQILTISKIDFEDPDSIIGFDNLLASISDLVQVDLNANFKTDTDDFEAYSEFTGISTNQNENNEVYTTEPYTVNCVVTTYILKV